MAATVDKFCVEAFGEIFKKPHDFLPVTVERSWNRLVVIVDK